MTTELQFGGAEALITSGGEGIGRGLAARFLAAWARVLVTGRTPAKLERAARDLPGLGVFRNDISRPEEREALAAYVQGAMHRPSVEGAPWTAAGRTEGGESATPRCSTLSEPDRVARLGPTGAR